MLIGARLGSPLVVGYGEGETYLGSDALALAPLTQRICYLEEGDWVIITARGLQVFDKDNNPSTAPSWPAARRGGGREGQFRHFMQKRSSSSPPWLPRHCAPMSVSWTRASRCPRSISTCRHSPRDHRGLRHVLLRRSGRQILVRGSPACRSTSMSRLNSVTATPF
jgi:hypothetical protein